VDCRSFVRGADDLEAARFSDESSVRPRPAEGWCGFGIANRGPHGVLGVAISQRTQQLVVIAAGVRQRCLLCEEVDEVDQCRPQGDQEGVEECVQQPVPGQRDNAGAAVERAWRALTATIEAHTAQEEAEHETGEDD
jgi:hypothetical protein